MTGAVEGVDPVVKPGRRNARRPPRSPGSDRRARRPDGPGRSRSERPLPLGHVEQRHAGPLGGAAGRRGGVDPGREPEADRFGRLQPRELGRDDREVVVDPVEARPRNSPGRALAPGPAGSRPRPLCKVARLPLPLLSAALVPAPSSKRQCAIRPCSNGLRRVGRARSCASARSGTASSDGPRGRTSELLLSWHRRQRGPGRRPPGLAPRSRHPRVGFGGRIGPGFASTCLVMRRRDDARIGRRLGRVRPSDVAQAPTPPPAPGSFARSFARFSMLSAFPTELRCPTSSTHRSGRYSRSSHIGRPACSKPPAPPPTPPVPAADAARAAAPPRLAPPSAAHVRSRPRMPRLCALLPLLPFVLSPSLSPSLAHAAPAAPAPAAPATAARGPAALANAKDPRLVVLGALKAELARSKQRLRLPKEDPPYFLRYLVRDYDETDIVGPRSGPCSNDDHTRARQAIGRGAGGRLPVRQHRRRLDRQDVRHRRLRSLRAAGRRPARRRRRRPARDAVAADRREVQAGAVAAAQEARRPGDQGGRGRIGGQLLQRGAGPGRRSTGRRSSWTAPPGATGCAGCRRVFKALPGDLRLAGQAERQPPDPLRGQQRGHRAGQRAADLGGALRRPPAAPPTGCWCRTTRASTAPARASCPTRRR